jgi:hypothetical protein
VLPVGPFLSLSSFFFVDTHTFTRAAIRERSADGTSADSARLGLERHAPSDGAGAAGVHAAASRQSIQAERRASIQAPQPPAVQATDNTARVSASSSLDPSAALTCAAVSAASLRWVQSATSGSTARQSAAAASHPHHARECHAGSGRYRVACALLPVSPNDRPQLDDAIELAKFAIRALEVCMRRFSVGASRPAVCPDPRELESSYRPKK